MGAAVNGLALHGGIVQAVRSTFLVFSDYMRPAIRMSALMRLPVVWVFTHDSSRRRGRAHPPAGRALRGAAAIPGLTVIRPADANETAEAWRMAIEEMNGPVCLLLTRQDVPVLEPSLVRGGVRRGGYVLRDLGGPLEVALVATGSEVSVALDAQDRLAAEGIATRVVSMPSWELFAAQDERHRRTVLPRQIPALSVEAGVAQGWSRFVDASVSIERFGASGPGAEVTHRLGITPERVAAAARDLIRLRGPATGRAPARR